MDGKYFILISIFFNVFGQYYMKLGMKKFGVVVINKDILITILKIIVLPNILLGLFLYVISAFFG
jgi:hypothetical protein